MPPGLQVPAPPQSDQGPGEAPPLGSGLRSGEEHSRGQHPCALGASMLEKASQDEGHLRGQYLSSGEWEPRRGDECQHSESHALPAVRPQEETGQGELPHWPAHCPSAWIRVAPVGRSGRGGPPWCPEEGLAAAAGSLSQICFAQRSRPPRLAVLLGKLPADWCELVGGLALCGLGTLGRTLPAPSCQGFSGAGVTATSCSLSFFLHHLPVRCLH